MELESARRKHGVNDIRQWMSNGSSGGEENTIITDHNVLNPTVGTQVEFNTANLFVDSNISTPVPN